MTPRDWAEKAALEVHIGDSTGRQYPSATDVIEDCIVGAMVQDEDSRRSPDYNAWCYLGFAIFIWTLVGAMMLFFAQILD